MRRILLTTILSLFVINAFSDVPHVRGWPDKIAMGTITDGNTYALGQLKERPVDSVFVYAGVNPGGDPGHLVPKTKAELANTKTNTMMRQLRDNEASIGKDGKVMPTFVFYTADGSSSDWTLMNDLELNPGSEGQFMWKHYYNLVVFAQTLESYKDTKHPVPATVIINPDFLGEVHKQCQEYNCPIPYKTQTIDVATSLKTAFEHLKQDGYLTSYDIPSEFLQADTKIPEYIRSINWIMHTYAPDVPFGWQDNVWAGDGSGHVWLHQAYTDPSLIQKHVDAEAAFIKEMKVYEDDSYKPDFFVLDKWERDVFDSSLKGVGVSYGYMYNGNDWSVYMKYATGLDEALGNLPLMLWQIPGGHLQLKDDPTALDDQGSTAPDYFFGDKALQNDLSNMKSYIADYAIDDKFTSKYDLPKYTHVRDYLTMPLSGEEGNFDWQVGHMDEVSDANVFAMLWGGGSTTGIIGNNSSLDDNGWLYNKIKAYEGK